MACRSICALIAVVALAGCGQSPSTPSSSSSLAAQAAVMSAMSQATSQMALAGSTTVNGSNVVTVPCAGGGSMVLTMSPLQAQTSPFRLSSRIEFRDCRNQSTTINGDPYVDTSIELTFATPGGAAGDSTSKMQTTGGVRINSNGVQGRVQFNCTANVSITTVNGSTPTVSVSSSGTMTFEQPLGSTPVVRPCG